MRCNCQANENRFVIFPKKEKNKSICSRKKVKLGSSNITVYQQWLGSQATKKSLPYYLRINFRFNKSLKSFEIKYDNVLK